MKFLHTIALLCCFIAASAQKDTTLQSLERNISKAADINAKLDVVKTFIEKSALYYPEVSKSYIDKSLFWAEESRDRNAMIKARRVASNYYLRYSNEKNKFNKAKQFADEAMKLLSLEGVSYKEKLGTNALMASISLYQGKAAEAFAYYQEAVAIANESNNDSLKILSLLGYGNTLQYFSEKIKAFKNFIHAQEIAEKSKDKAVKQLLYTVYGSMVSFYKSIENYDKSIDYQYKMLANYKTNKQIDEQLNTLYAIGDNYREAKKYNAAKGVFDAMGKLADSVKNAKEKTNSSIGYLNTILDSDEKDKALEYLKNHPDISAVFQKIGMAYMLDYGYANVYQRLEKKDSAAYYYEKALGPIEAKASIFQQMDFYAKYAYHLYTVGNYNKAIAFLTKAKYYADSTKNSTMALSVVDYLDSCHQKIGDYKSAFSYASLKNKIKAELDEKSKAKDLLTLEIDTENKRAERQAKEEAEETIKRHNWQYMAIIIAIISLFSLLAVLGVFNVSVRLVKALGFISFIFLFEFLILIADTWIHHATHGEPWKVLAIKVVLIALLMPLHHWLEHKAIHFITTRRRKEAIV